MEFHHKTSPLIGQRIDGVSKPPKSSLRCEELSCDVTGVLPGVF